MPGVARRAGFEDIFVVFKISPDAVPFSEHFLSCYLTKILVETGNDRRTKEWRNTFLGTRYLF
jgi:hypothetical protein